MNIVSVAGQDGRVVATLAGDIDAGEVDRVNSQILAEVDNDVRVVLVDLTHVTYLDSSGIQLMFDLIRRFHAARQAVGIVVPESSPLSTLLKITHVHEACPVSPTVEECFQAIGNDAKLY